MTDMLFCEEHQRQKPARYDRTRGYLPDEYCPVCLREAVIRLQAAIPEDLRAMGWCLMAHHDEPKDGVVRTRWVFSKGARLVTGEGATDAEALGQIRGILREEA